jgi:hypothetical protein
MGGVLTKVPALLLVVSFVSVPVAVRAQEQTARPANGTAEEEIELPVSLARIKEGIAREPAIRAQEKRPVFRVEVIAKSPTIVDILGPDYLTGPAPYGGMTHQEFLNMVTPVEYRGYSMFTNTEGLTVAATSLALKWAYLKAVDKLKEARTERAKEAAKKEVLEAMNQLEEARKKARK